MRRAVAHRAADPARSGDLLAVLATVAGAGGHAPEADTRGAVTVRVDGDEVLPDVVARLRAAGITAEEFSLHLPSLDEVFFTLTGTRSGDDTHGIDNHGIDNHGAQEVPA